jgi:glutamyl-tRNA synthetase
MQRCVSNTTIAFLEDFLAPQTEVRVQAFADCNMVDLPKNTVVQFERKGYFKLDREHRKDERMVFFDVPSGKS